MQSHQLLINRFFSATTLSSGSDLQVVNDYLLHVQSGLGGGLVNETNVRGFLNNDNNERIIKSFFSYLTGNTSTSEFREIFYDDKKLADVFNVFYNTTVLQGNSGSAINKTVISQNLTGTTSVSSLKNLFLWEGDAVREPMGNISVGIQKPKRDKSSITTLESFTEEESYYVPVILNKHFEETSRNIFQVCVEKFIKEINVPQGNVANNVFVKEFGANLGVAPNVGQLSSGVQITEATGLGGLGGIETVGANSDLEGFTIGESSNLAGFTIGGVSDSPESSETVDIVTIDNAASFSPTNVAPVPTNIIAGGSFDVAPNVNVNAVTVSTIVDISQGSTDTELEPLTTLPKRTPSKVINSVLQCFVDLNLNLDPKSFWNVPEARKVGFSKNLYSVNEGKEILIGVSLNKPSELGIEEVQVDIVRGQAIVKAGSGKGSIEDSGPAEITSDLKFDKKSFFLRWKVGEQEQLIPIKAILDLFVEGSEFFDLTITRATNVQLDESKSVTKLEVVDKTVPRKIFIDTVGGLLDSSGNLSFTILEGKEISVKISLDNKSVAGGEEVTISTDLSTASQNDFTISPTTLKWSKGQQDKTIKIKANKDTLREVSESFTLKLSNLHGIQLSDKEATTANIEIIDDSPVFQHIELKIPGLYVQKGSPKTSTQSKLGWIKGNQNSFISKSDLKLESMLKFKYPIYQGELLSNTKYEFDSATLIITNTGEFDALINSTIHFPKGTIQRIEIKDFNSSIKLSTNDGVITNSNVNPANPTQTLTKAKYQIEFEVSYVGQPFANAFDIGNSTAFALKSGTNGKLSLGEFVLNGLETESLAQSSPYILQTTYDNARTNKDNTSLTCSNTFGGSSINYVRTAEIEGIAFLTNNSLTTYNKFNFIQRATIFGTTCAEADMDGISDKGITSIAFH